MMHRSGLVHVAPTLAVLVRGIAARPNNGTFTAFNTTSSLSSSTTPLPNITTTADASISWQTAGTDPAIPGLVELSCYTNEQDLAPCDAVCGDDDPSCVKAASSQAAACFPQWDAYNNASASWAATYFPPGSTTVAEIVTETYMSYEYASYSTDTAVSFTNYQGSIYNPVYAFGTPSTYFSPYPPETFTQAFANNAPPMSYTQLSTYTTQGTVTVLTMPEVVPQAYLFTEPTPYCSVTSVYTIGCNQCTIGGGSVQLFYWPSTSSYGNLTRTPSTAATAVVSGITMTSPSVYISLQTVLATNDCRRVGGAYAGSVLTMDPKSVSTVFGANGPGYGPGMAARIDYNDLEGVVPVSVYEINNNCARFGCATIANDLYRPTLAIPPEIRTLDPAWAGCVIDLDGLYDPPSALTAETALPVPSLPPQGAISATPPAAPSSPPAAPSSAPAAPSPTPTNPSPRPTSIAMPDSNPSGLQPTASPPSPESPGTAPGHAAHPGTFAPPPNQSSSQDAPSPEPGVSIPPANLQPDQSAPSQSDPNSPLSVSSPALADTTPTNEPGRNPGAPISPDAPEISSGTPVIGPGAPVITLGSQSYTQQSGFGGFVIGTQTLTPGGAVTVSGSTLSLPSSGPHIVVDGTTELFASGTGFVGSAPGTLQSIGALSVTENASGNVIVDGTTLEPGQDITIGSGSSQMTLSVFTTDSKTELVLGTSTTMTLSPPSTSSPVDATNTGSNLGAVPSPTHRSDAAISTVNCYGFLVSLALSCMFYA